MFLEVNIPLKEYIIPSLYLDLWNLAFDLTGQKKMMSLRELIDCEIKFRKSDHLKEQSLSLRPACCHRPKESGFELIYSFLQLVEETGGLEIGRVKFKWKKSLLHFLLA